MSKRSTLVAAVLGLALALSLVLLAIAQEDGPAPVAARTDAALGSILVDPSGWTLYTFTSDGPEASSCTDTCAAVWLPLLVDGPVVAPDDLPGTLTAFPRDDGALQAAYNAAPLYLFSGDAQPGDTNGHGVGGRWFAASSGLTPASDDQPATAPPTAQPNSQATAGPVAAPTERPTPPSSPTVQPTATPAPTSIPAPTPRPYSPPPRMGY